MRRPALRIVIAAAAVAALAAADPAGAPAPAPPPYDPSGWWTYSVSDAKARFRFVREGDRLFIRDASGFDSDGTRWEAHGQGPIRADGREAIVYWSCLNPDAIWTEDRRRGGWRLHHADEEPDPRFQDLTNSAASEGWIMMRFVPAGDPGNALPANGRWDYLLSRYFHTYHLEYLRSDGMSMIHYPDNFTDVGQPERVPAADRDRVWQNLKANAAFSWRRPRPIRSPLPFRGTVLDPRGNPVEGAEIRAKGLEGLLARSRADGTFSFALPSADGRYPDIHLLAAARKGSYTDVLPVLAGQEEGLRFRLRPIRRDHGGYTFISPHPVPRAEDPTGASLRDFHCGACHVERYEEWQESRHAGASKNPWVRAIDERAFRPDRAAGRAAAGSAACGACHVPSAALETARLVPPAPGEKAGKPRFEGGEVDWARLRGADLDGNHCDLCHKVLDVEDPDRPGILGSLKVVRPDPAGDDPPGPVKLTMSPVADATYAWMGASYNPLFRESLLCAGCHQERRDDGVVLDDTYDAWRASRYARPGSEGRTCQDCHMPAVENPPISLVYRAIQRYPRAPNHSHRFAGPGLMPPPAVTWTAERAGNRIRVRVRIENAHAGHAVPTGFPLRQVILALRAEGPGGAPLRLVEGPALPASAGEFAGWGGILLERRLAGSAEHGVVWPWRAAAAGEDGRLAAGASREETFALEAPAGPARLALQGVRRRMPRAAVGALGLPEDPKDPLDTPFFAETKEVPP